jgi:catechol 2,3-dioxygenase-like lactoylglutathione lyase family enzyme
MVFQLHHIGLLTDDLPTTIRFYEEKLGMRVVAHRQKKGHHDVALLADTDPSTRLLLRVAGPPLPAWLQPEYDAHGPGLDLLAFTVEDIHAWRERLQGMGVDVGPPPADFLDAQRFSSRDPQGNPLEWWSRPGPKLRASGGRHSRKHEGLRFRLSHFNITSPDIAQLDQFYVSALGFARLHDLREHGMIFIADPQTPSEPRQIVTPLELFGPPGLWGPDEDFLARHGPGLQYLCFAVGNVDAAHRDLISKQVECTLEPTDVDGNRVAFFKDPNGVDIEVLRPLPDGLIRPQAWMSRSTA